MQQETNIQALFTSLQQCSFLLDELADEVILMLIHRIATIVSDASGIDLSDIRGNSRKSDIVNTRHVITIYSLQCIPGSKQRHIAKYFGRERTTVVYLCRQAQGLYDVEDPLFMSLYRDCKVRIENFITQL